MKELWKSFDEELPPLSTKIMVYVSDTLYTQYPAGLYLMYLYNNCHYPSPSKIEYILVFDHPSFNPKLGLHQLDNEKFIRVPLDLSGHEGEVIQLWRHIPPIWIKNIEIR